MEYAYHYYFIFKSDQTKESKIGLSRHAGKIHLDRPYPVGVIGEMLGMRIFVLCKH